ncbi:MAG: HAD-IA family hydrolase [Bacilli bacterium]
MKKAIIFDLDGTLLNTIDDLKNAVNHVLILHNWPQRTTEQIRQAIGNGVAKLVERSLPQQATKNEYLLALHEFRLYYSEHYDENTHPYQDIIQLIKKLKNDGFLLAVCTNKTQLVAEKLIHHFFNNSFDFIQGDQTDVPKKPAPNMIDRILQFLQIKRNEALYIGDTDVDRQTALNSQLDYFIVSYGYRTQKELGVLCPDSEIIDTVKKLYSCIKK